VIRRALLALALVVTPAFAEQAHLNGMAEAVLASEWADPITLDDYLFEPIGFDSEEVETSFLPDYSYLSAVQETFGGTPITEEIFEGTLFAWLCYETGKGRTTFVSVHNGEGDDTLEPPIAAGPVLSVIVEEMNAPANAACTTNAAAAAPQPTNSIPTLGATTADLQARFGSAPVDAGGHVAYVTEYAMGDEDGWTEQKIIYYRLENDTVTGVAYRLNTIG
jgi:hypothetical protein